MPSQLRNAGKTARPERLAYLLIAFAGLLIDRPAAALGFTRRRRGQFPFFPVAGGRGVASRPFRSKWEGESLAAHRPRYRPIDEPQVESGMLLKLAGSPRHCGRGQGRAPKAKHRRRGDEEYAVD